MSICERFSSFKAILVAEVLCKCHNILLSILLQILNRNKLQSFITLHFHTELLGPPSHQIIQKIPQAIIFTFTFKLPICTFCGEKVLKPKWIKVCTFLNIIVQRQCTTLYHTEYSVLDMPYIIRSWKKEGCWSAEEEEG